MRERTFKNWKKVFLGGGCAKEFLKIRRNSSWEENTQRFFKKLEENLLGRRMRRGIFKN